MVAPNVKCKNVNIFMSIGCFDNYCLVLPFFKKLYLLYILFSSYWVKVMVLKWMSWNVILSTTFQHTDSINNVPVVGADVQSWCSNLFSIQYSMSLVALFGIPCVTEAALKLGYDYICLIQNGCAFCNHLQEQIYS